jgi:hypothetical protein
MEDFVSFRGIKPKGLSSIFLEAVSKIQGVNNDDCQVPIWASTLVLCARVRLQHPGSQPVSALTP